MKRFPFLSLTFIFTLILTSCSPQVTRTPIPQEKIKPGDSIGGFTVEQGSPDLPYFSFQYFCDFILDGTEPTTSETDCEVPGVSGLVLPIGWLAKESKFSSNWDDLEWELSIDGKQISLEDFEWVELSYSIKLEDTRSRTWYIDLKNLVPGQHTIQYVIIMKNSIDDGFKVYQPGRYEYKANFTVLEPPEYQTFSAGAGKGQQAFSLESTGQNFLFYLPQEYQSDSGKSWPLLVFLHGTHLRGATLEMLRMEPLPKSLESDPAFPFVVVSPIADGEYQFWIEEDTTRSLLSLLDEIQSQYSIDQNRIYLIGDDMGGNGVWLLGLEYPDLFAALVPIGGYIGYPFEVPANICELKDVPVWAFHGGKDVYVPASVQQDLVDALTACGGTAKITIYQDMTINIVFNVYKDPELYSWLLEQSK